MSLAFRPYTVFDQSWQNPYIRRIRNPFNDLRFANTFETLSSRLVSEQQLSIQKIAADTKMADQFYRFLGSDRVTVQEVIHMNCLIEPEIVENRDVLHLGDTSTYNMSKRLGRIQDTEKLGVLQDMKTPGFFLHAGLAVNAEDLSIIGLADIQLWNRPKDLADSLQKESTQPAGLSGRESFKWQNGSTNASNLLANAGRVTHVYDREADFFDLIDHIVNDLGDDLVIRAKHDREVIWQGREILLSGCLEQSIALGTYEVELPALDHYSWTHGKRIRRGKRVATLELRAERVKVIPPEASKKKHTVDLYIVEAKEVTKGLPKDEQPVCWRLWTTHGVESFEAAKKIVKFYASRWMVEQLFRTTKKKGFNQEATELGSVDAILKQTVMVVGAACKVLQLVYARDKKQGPPIENVFDKQEQQVLQKLNERLQGNTKKLKNPFPPDRLSSGAWVIARLGGWKGYQSQKPPGPLTMKYGLDKFYSYLEAFILFNSD